MKLEEWENRHKYGLKRVCKFCKYSTVFTDKGYIQAVHCVQKSMAGVGKSVKQNHSCNLWEDKK